MLTSITIIRYRKPLIPIALLAMAIHRLPLSLRKGCTFWKLLGSGRNGTFDLKPDWQQWGLLAVWKSREDFDQFQKKSFITGWWKLFAHEGWTILLDPIQSHGKWDGKQPFGNGNNNAVYNGPIAVLTRATIRTRRLKNFWSNVDEVANIMASAKGYVTSIGIGEAPIYRQATFSIWESVDDVKAFAYRSREHAEVIKKTRSEDWYSEELFARFRPIESFGTLHGADPLKGLLNFVTQ